LGNFIKIKTDIQDLYIIENKVYSDERGFFLEAYHKSAFEEIGLNMEFVQDNHSKSVKGVLRGLHFQKNQPQGKIVRVINGEVFDVAVDLRKDSKTYLKWHGVRLSGEDNKMFYIPEGFAHGFLVLSDIAEFQYKCTNYYDAKDESGIIWNDKDINIKWPIELVDEIILSEKDKNLKSFKNLNF
jgi:dTDP-4-dehydrorhamnose 3,5-epimerase